MYLTVESVASASSALGVPGTVAIQASVTDVSGSVAQLPLLQGPTLLRASIERCLYSVTLDKARRNALMKKVLSRQKLSY
jgi:hypothetical protein